MMFASQLEGIVQQFPCLGEFITLFIPELFFVDGNAYEVEAQLLKAFEVILLNVLFALQVMNARDIIIAPIITEKSVAALGDKKYTFRVADGANKIEIAKAVEEIFGVKVSKVNTISMKGKKRRMGRFEGYTSDWKKAVVTLTEDSKTIEFFDGLF